MNLELYQIIGNQAFDDAFYAEMNGRLKAGNAWNKFTETAIENYKQTGKLPIWISYTRNTGVSPHRQIDDSGDALTMP